MSTVLDFLSALEDGELATVAKACLAWDRTGILGGDAAQVLANNLGSATGLGEAWPLDEVPKLIYQETARRFVAAH